MGNKINTDSDFLLESYQGPHPREWKVKRLIRELNEAREEYFILCANDNNNHQYLSKYKELDITIKMIAQFIEFNHTEREHTNVYSGVLSNKPPNKPPNNLTR